MNIPIRIFQRSATFCYIEIKFHCSNVGPKLRNTGDIIKLVRGSDHSEDAYIEEVA